MDEIQAQHDWIVSGNVTNGLGIRTLLLTRDHDVSVFGGKVVEQLVSLLAHITSTLGLDTGVEWQSERLDIRLVDAHIFNLHETFIANKHDIIVAFTKCRSGNDLLQEGVRIAKKNRAGFQAVDDELLAFRAALSAVSIKKSGELG